MPLLVWGKRKGLIYIFLFHSGFSFVNIDEQRIQTATAEKYECRVAGNWSIVVQNNRQAYRVP